MFIGRYNYNLDSKGRIVLPLEYRKQMGTSLYISKGYEKCLTIYTTEGWTKFYNDVMKLNSISEDVRNYKRYMLGESFLKEFDLQGRINLEPSLIKHAEITKEAVIVGNGDVIEVWSLENWLEIERARENSIINLGNKLSENMR